MIKSYQDFLSNINESFENQFDNFLHVVKSFCCSNKVSFSYLAQNNVRFKYEIENIEKKIEILKKAYGHLNLYNLLNERTDYIYEYFGDKQNGISDIILNHFNSEKFPLSGDYIINDVDTLIKYLYGWHHTKYGMIAILESFDTIEDYYDYVKSGLNKYDIYCFNNVKEVKDNFIFGENFNNDISSYEYFNKDLDKDVYFLDSKITDQSLAVILYPNSKYEIKINDKYIVDFLIKSNLEKYITVFEFDVSHIEDKYIKKLSNVSKIVKKFNI